MAQNESYFLLCPRIDIAVTSVFRFLSEQQSEESEILQFIQCLCMNPERSYFCDCAMIFSVVSILQVGRLL